MTTETKRAIFVRATRARGVPVMLVPAFAGAALGWERSGAHSLAGLAALVAGVTLAMLGANVLADAGDEASGAEPFARRDYRSIATGSGVLGAGLVAKPALFGVAATLLSGAVACYALAGMLTSWAVLGLGAGSIALATQQTWKPLRLAYAGRGLGDLAVAGFAGALPFAAGYASQARRLDGAAWWGGIVPAVLVTLILYHQTLLRWRSDAEARKMTVAAAFGPAIAIAVARILTVIAAVTLAVEALVFRLWPPGAFACVLGLAPVAAGHARALTEPTNDSYVRVLGVTIGATVVIGAALVLAEAIRVWLR